MLPYSLRKAIYGFKARIRKRKNASVEARLVELRTIITHNFPIHQVPPATGKLRLLQEGNAVLLNLFARRCEEHGLRYWLDLGTLLGAVRHRGFIPWDEDLDVSMTAQEYEKLVKLLPVIFPKEEGFSWSVRSFLQIGYEGTPLNIDVFPWFFHSSSFSEENRQLVYAGTDFIKRKCVSVGAYTNMPPEKLKSLICEKIMRGCDAADEADEPAMFVSPAVGFLKNTYFAYSDIFPLKKMTFEGGEYNVPHHTRSCLQFYYGDYMSYPPQVGYWHAHMEAVVKSEPFEKAVNLFIDRYGQ